jgi:hypothetical protein
VSTESALSNLDGSTLIDDDGWGALKEKGTDGRDSRIVVVKRTPEGDGLYALSYFEKLRSKASLVHANFARNSDALTRLH